MAIASELTSKQPGPITRFFKRLLLKGGCNRLTYFFTGIVGVFLKYDIDRYTLYDPAKSFLRDFTPISYLSPEFRSHLMRLPPDVALTFALTAIPFLWIGISHTLLRLKDAGLPSGLCFLFFVPVANFLLFLLLSVLPTGAFSEGKWTTARYGPETAAGAATLSVAITAGLSLCLTLFSTNVLNRYGGGLFLGIPFCCGFSTTLLAARNGEITFGRAFLLSLLSTTLIGALLLLFAFEGLGCIIMAAPIGYTLSALGAVFACLLLRFGHLRKSASVNVFSGLLLLILMENRLDLTPPVFETTTTMMISAPPPTVWRNVVTFSEITEPPDILSKMGISYPVRARIEGRGPGAIRYCEFSTGPFVEPITVWNEPHELTFDVTHTPPPLEEWSPWGRIQPPHVEGYFLSKGGRFLLERAAGGGTLVKATTWHRHSIWPAHYWKFWADLLIHNIHSRVLLHIKRLSEAEAAR